MVSHVKMKIIRKAENSMIETPPALQSKFKEYLRDKAIPDGLHGMYQKGLRFYLDFFKNRIQKDLR